MKFSLSLPASILMVACALAACKKAEEPDPRTGTPRDTIGPTTIKKDSVDYIIDTAAGRRSIPFTHVNGVVAYTASGMFAGTWKFDDVTATILEDADPKILKPAMYIEAHKSPPDDHMKLRFMTNDLKEGTYNIDPENKAIPRLEASWEHTFVVFATRPGASGSVTISKLSADSVVGTFDVTLIAMSEKKEPETIKGQFNLEIQKSGK